MNFKKLDEKLIKTITQNNDGILPNLRELRSSFQDASPPNSISPSSSPTTSSLSLPLSEKEISNSEKDLKISEHYAEFNVTLRNTNTDKEEPGLLILNKKGVRISLGKTTLNEKYNIDMRVESHPSDSRLFVFFLNAKEKLLMAALSPNQRHIIEKTIEQFYLTHFLKLQSN